MTWLSKLARDPSMGSPTILALLLLMFAVAARLPHFVRLIIGSDEATFILMGQSLLEGHLPYVENWDIKPPLAFVPFALFEGLFGTSIEGVRLGGAVFLAGAAFLTALVGRRLWNPRAGLLAGVLLIVFVGAVKNGQATGTEIIAIVPLTGALAVLVLGKGGRRTLFAAGLLLGIAGMVRLNLAYTALAVGAYLTYGVVRHRTGDGFTRLACYGLGGAIAVGATALPYVATGQGELWFRSVFLASMSFGESAASFDLSRLQEQGGIGIDTALVWGGALFGTVWIATAWRGLPPERRAGIAIVLVFLAGTGWSIIESGRGRAHYVIQAAPFLGLIAAAFFERLLQTRHRWWIAAAIVVGLLFPAKPVVTQYLRVTAKLLIGVPIHSGRGYDVAAYLNQHNPDRKPIFVMHDHIVYWLTGMTSPTPMTTHPSNIEKNYLLRAVFGDDASTTMELEKVFAREPLFIVKRIGIAFNGDPEAQARLDRELAEHYTLVQSFEDRQVYERTR